MGIFMDIQKFFDSLDRDILLNKLIFYGITGTELVWFKSFLNDRRHFVKYKDFKSISKCVLSGVPQGSVLSPFFYKFFDLVKCVLYADDTNLFVESDTINGLYMLRNQAVPAYNDWFLANRLILNKSKTLHVIFHRTEKAAASLWNS